MFKVVAIWDYILDLKKKKGKTVILTTNYLEEANTLCDRIAIIDHGILVALDTPINLKQKHGDTIVREIETMSPVSLFVLAQLRALKSITEVIQNSMILRVVLRAIFL